MKSILFAFQIILVMFLSGCATQPIPADYSGPIATITDSTVSETSQRAQFYFLEEIDGRSVENSLTKTGQNNSGNGFTLMTSGYSRDVPARRCRLKLVARIGYGAPIQALLNTKTLYKAEKVIEVTLDSNKTYVVKGQLSASGQEVWLEEAGSGKKVE